MAGLICTGFMFGTGSTARNVILNSSVESGGSAGPDYWVSSGTGAKWNMTSAYTGSHSIEIDVSNASSEWTSAPAAIGGGRDYSVSGAFEGEVMAGQFFFGVRWFSDSQGHNTLSENDFSPINNNSGWVSLQNVFTAPNGAISCGIFLEAINGTGHVSGDNFEVRQVESTNNFVDGISLALITYLVSYYAIKAKFKTQVQKQSKLFTTGIGIYVLAWIVFWVLLYTAL
jgi:hypothetical protein